jgi:hypothetical protein
MGKATLAKKIIASAKKELKEEREKNLHKEAKIILEELSEAKRTVNLLERKLRNFMRKVDE